MMLVERVPVTERLIAVEYVPASPPKARAERRACERVAQKTDPDFRRPREFGW